MFSEYEVYDIEKAKNHIKTLIGTRSLLWNGITRNVVIAGGFFTSVLQNTPFKDVDIFILNNDVDVYNNLTERQQRPLWRRSEMMSYMHNKNIVDVINNTKTDAQYILTKYKTREELLSHFDYKHCKVSFVPAEDKLYINRETFDCIKNKILKWNNNKQLEHPNQIYRKNRFLNQGWVLETDKKEEQSYGNILMQSYEKLNYEKLKELKEEAAAKMLDAYGLPPMQQQKEYVDAYSMAAPVPYDNQGFIAQTVDNILQIK
jgi:hypothetical protein